MKMSRKLLAISVVLFSLVATPAFSMSIGRNGKPFEEKGTQWQPMQFEDQGTGVRAAFPGSPTSGISSPWYFMFSEFNSVGYEIHTAMSKSLKFPKSKKDFEKELQKELTKNDSYTVLKLSDPNVLFAADIKNEKGAPAKMVRIFYTSDLRIYYAIVEGPDLSLAPDFFNKIQFFKK